jgi:glycosyltransferase involved in cell wall biosynthesis
MSAPRLLILTTYPFAMPLQGGQVRIANIARIYAEAGFAVQPVSVYAEESAADIADAARDVPFPADSPFRHYRGKPQPRLNDLLTGRFAAEDEAAYARICALIQAPPDVIHLEQPWLLPLVERLVREGPAAGARLVYGSQNVEWRLMQQVLQHVRAGIGAEDAADADAAIEDIRALEERACTQADLVLACSEADQAVLAGMGARCCILAGNGIAREEVHARLVRKWQRRLPGRFALFVSSSHPPNITGFVECLGTSLAFLPPDRAICIAGGVGRHIAPALEKGRWRDVNKGRLRILGFLDAADLAAVKSLAHVFILPIREGGGSNIKAAEALYSGKYVLGTRVGLRGFESIMARLDGVRVEDGASGFRSTLTQLLDQPPLRPDPGLAPLRDTLLWQNTLAGLPVAVRQLIQ